MKPYEIKLIAKLLEIVAKELGHSLVECDLTEAGLTAEEAYQVNLAYAKWAGREGDWEEDELRGTDAVVSGDGLMTYFADRLRKASEVIDGASQNKRRSAPEHPPATPEHLYPDAMGVGGEVFLIYITAYSWLPPQVTFRYTMKEAIALRDELAVMGYCVEVVEVKHGKTSQAVSHQGIATQPPGLPRRLYRHLHRLGRRNSPIVRLLPHC